MDIHQLIALFGKEYRDKELVEFFQQDNFDIVKDVQNYMKTDSYAGAESSAYASNYSNGYELHFADELDYLDIEDGRYGESGNYYFTVCGFYAQGVEGYNQYNGELLNGIKMTDSQEILRAKMGNNYRRHDFLDVDIWNNVNGCQVFVDYKEKNTPQIISISLEK
jgi:hypothetical protein